MVRQLPTATYSDQIETTEIMIDDKDGDLINSEESVDFSRIEVVSNHDSVSQS